jgi:CAAX prenyl protease-like protein
MPAKFFLLLCLVAAVPQFSFAQTGSSSVAEPSGASAARAISQYTPPPENYAKAIAYSHARYRHYFVNAFYGIVVWILVLAWGLGAKYRNWAERVSRRRFVEAMVFTPLLILTVSLLTLPTDIWDHWLSRSFGLSVQGWGSYFSDWAKSQVLLWIVATILAFILYAVIRRSPRRWWFYFWMATIPVIIFILFLEPMVIEPLFYQFKPLQASHPDLVEKLEEVVQRGGMSVPPQRM